MLTGLPFFTLLSMSAASPHVIVLPRGVIRSGVSALLSGFAPSCDAPARKSIRAVPTSANAPSANPIRMFFIVITSPEKVGIRCSVSDDPACSCSNGNVVHAASPESAYIVEKCPAFVIVENSGTAWKFANCAA